MFIQGQCHCGNIAFSLSWEPDPVEIPVRACNCSFCIKHGGMWAANADGALKVRIGDPSLLSKYTFGTATAQFHVCTRCGVVPVVTSLIDGRLYAVVNVNTFEDIDPSLLRSSPVSFDGEGTDSRLARRARHWIANVEYTQNAV